MRYDERPPASDLASIIRCVWTLSDGGVAVDPGGVSAEPALPDGSPELIFSLGDPFEHAAASGTITRQPRAFLVGQITAPMLVRPTGRTDLVAIRFESDGASILHPDLRRLTDGWAEVSALGQPALRALERTLGTVTDPERRVQLAEAAIRSIAAASLRPDPRVSMAVRAIRESHGGVAQDALAASLSVAPRTLQRLFATQVGITPKHLARIVRFQRVFSAWRSDPRSLARVAAECGYFDQSHLVRDFRDLAGMPPAALLASLPAFTGLFLQ